MRHGAGKSHPLPLAAGKTRAVASSEVKKIHLPQHLPRERARIIRRIMGQTPKFDRLEHGHAGRTGIVLTHHGTVPRALGRAVARDLTSVEHHASVIRLQQPGQDREQSGFAGAIGTDDGNEFSRRYSK